MLPLALLDLVHVQSADQLIAGSGLRDVLIFASDGVEVNSCCAQRVPQRLSSYVHHRLADDEGLVLATRLFKTSSTTLASPSAAASSWALVDGPV